MSAAASKHRALAAASVLAAALLAIVGAAAGAPPDRDDTEPPTPPTNVHVKAATTSSVTVAWSPSTDNVEVVAYEVSSVAPGTASPGAKFASRTRDTQFVADRLTCGETFSLWITAFDRAKNRSGPAQATMAAAPCSDTRRPTAPSGFRQAATSQDAVVLAWDPSSDDTGVVGYGLYRGGVPLMTTSEPAATIAGLACGSVYETEVDAFDAAGNRSQRGKAWVQTAACASPPPSDTTPPSQPSSLAVSSATQTSVTLSWAPSSDNVGVQGYGVYRNGALVTTVAQTGASVSGLSCGTAYTFAVDAYDAAGNRSSKASVTGTTAACASPPPPSPADTTPPSQPSSLAVSASTRTSVSLTWSASTDNVGVTGYGVYRNSTLVANVSSPGATVSDLTCGTAYTFAVDAYDAAGNRSTRASVTGTTAACADTQAPTAPTNVQASSRTATSIALSWSASSDNVGVVGYGLYKGGVLAGTSSTTSGIFANLTCNTNYTLGVDAYDAAGNRSSKTTVMVATTACPDTTPPSAPTGLAVSNVSQTGVSVAWIASSDNVGVAGYDVYRDGAKVGTTTGTSYALSNLTCGKAYALEVVAFDAAGNRSGPGGVTAVTSACSTSSVSYPASYFTGPLGNRNPLPLKKGAFLLTWPGSTGCDWTCIKAQVAEREQAMGRRFDGIGNAWRPHESERVEQWIHDRGALPIITWNVGPPQDVISGAKDAEIIEFARYIKAYDFIVMVRLFHEFDLPHTNYHACGATFIAQWRRVVDVFKQQGVTNAGFWWPPTEGANRACVEGSYPGDAYVDWVGTSGYNWVYVGEDKWATPMHSGWAEFSEVFNYPPGAGYQSYYSMYGPRKPFVIGETGTVYDASRKGNWYRNIVSAAKQMEHLTGVMFFDQDVSSVEGSRHNWLVDYPRTNSDVYAGFVAMARDPHFNTR